MLNYYRFSEIVSMLFPKNRSIFPFVIKTSDCLTLLKSYSKSEAGTSEKNHITLNLKKNSTKYNISICISANFKK